MLRLARLPSLLLCIGLAGCAHGGRGSDARDRAQEQLLAAGWIDAPLIGAATREDPPRLAMLAEAGARGRVLRLDRLLDLYDAARFAGDREARESLWLALGGHRTTRGIEASREVALRLLDEAYAIEDLAAADAGARAELGEDGEAFLGDAIMLLSTDMFLPDSAETLISQTLAYRVLTEQGHPRVADNARWRLYDHVRAVVSGAVEVGPGQRAEVMVHALYADREDISAWLNDVAVHSRPPLPDAGELWALLERYRQPLAALPRWLPVLDLRREGDAQLLETAEALLPRPRDRGWSLVSQPRGAGQPEALAPVVLLTGDELVLEPTSASPREPAASQLKAALASLLARDGRGTLLLASAPEAPAPRFAALLAAMVEARVTTVEFAIHEPGIHGTPGEGPVLLALPMYIARADDLAPGTRALREARIHIQLSGRGPRVRIDGSWLSTTPALPSQQRLLAHQLRRAYPRERAVSLALGADVQPRQLIDVLAAFSGGHGGASPAFLAVGYLPELTVGDEPRGEAQADRRFEARLTMAESPPRIAVVDGEQLSADARARLEAAAQRLPSCMLELDGELPRAGLTLVLDFDHGELTELSLGRLGRRAAERREPVERCIRERLLGLRLATGDEATQAPQTTRVTLSIAAGEVIDGSAFEEPADVDG